MESKKEPETYKFYAEIEPVPDKGGAYVRFPCVPGGHTF